VTEDVEALARAIVDGGRYMTIATADAGGVPWVSPVWYAPAGYSEFFWVSDPEARHSRNIAVRREVSVVIFDSGATIGTGRGVYVAAVAEEVGGSELDRGIEVFSRRSVEQGAAAWTLEDVRPPARLRLYRASALETYIGDRNDRRVRVRF
jgi:hypothetical protein